MHDIKLVRDYPEKFDREMERRGLGPFSGDILGFDQIRRASTTRLQEMETRRNALAREIGLAKRAGQETAALEAEATHIKSRLSSLESEVARSISEQKTFVGGLPNFLHEDVPDGADESANIECKRHLPLPELVFAPKQHFEIGEALGMMDFEVAARLAGARFTVLRGELARFERALGQFMIDLHVTKAKDAYEEIAVPGLVNRDALFGTGQMPKFEADIFETKDSRYLIPTAEVPLTNLIAGQIVPAAKLPIRVTALTDCYRREAGSAGRDTRGMLRQHQFKKVELVSIVAPEDSDAEHERMTRCAEAVLEKLKLPYRRMLLCAGDTGFSAAKTYDLEVWLPGQGAWREISSCSNCRDFQARRMNARMRGPDGKSTRMLHTLNGSGVAVGRALIAVMENYQQQDGSITVPEVLRPYMGGMEVIRRP